MAEQPTASVQTPVMTFKAAFGAFAVPIEQVVKLVTDVSVTPVPFERRGHIGVITSEHGLVPVMALSTPPWRDPNIGAEISQGRVLLLLLYVRTQIVALYVDQPGRVLDDVTPGKPEVLQFPNLTGLPGIWLDSGGERFFYFNSDFLWPGYESVRV